VIGKYSTKRQKRRYTFLKISNGKWQRAVEIGWKRISSFGSNVSGFRGDNWRNSVLVSKVGAEQGIPKKKTHDFSHSDGRAKRKPEGATVELVFEQRIEGKSQTNAIP
jgi:hypothetical protein